MACESPSVERGGGTLEIALRRKERTYLIIEENGWVQLRRGQTTSIPGSPKERHRDGGKILFYAAGKENGQQGKESPTKKETP